MPGCMLSATKASFSSVEKRRLRATPVITSTFENVSDIGTCLGLSLGPPAKAGVRSKRGAVQHPFIEVFVDTPIEECMRRDPKGLYEGTHRRDSEFHRHRLPYELPEAAEVRLTTVDADAEAFIRPARRRTAPAPDRLIARSCDRALMAAMARRP